MKNLFNIITAWLYAKGYKGGLDMSTPCNCERCRNNLEGCHWEGFRTNADGVPTYLGEDE